VWISGKFQSKITFYLFTFSLLVEFQKALSGQSDNVVLLQVFINLKIASWLLFPFTYFQAFKDFLVSKVYNSSWSNFKNKIKT